MVYMFLKTHVYVSVFFTFKRNINHCQGTPSLRVIDMNVGEDTYGFDHNAVHL